MNRRTNAGRMSQAAESVGRRLRHGFRGGQDLRVMAAGCLRLAAREWGPDAPLPRCFRRPWHIDVIEQDELRAAAEGLHARVLSDRRAHAGNDKP